MSSLLRSFDERARHSCLTFSSSSSLLADKTNLTPFLAKQIAKPFPIPLEAPVTQTTFPRRLAEKLKIIIRTIINMFSYKSVVQIFL